MARARALASGHAAKPNRVMRAVIGEILPLALVVTLSPLNIIPSILLLFSERPVRTASMDWWRS